MTEGLHSANILRAADLTARKVAGEIRDYGSSKLKDDTRQLALTLGRAVTQLESGKMAPLTQKLLTKLIKEANANLEDLKRGKQLGSSKMETPKKRVADLTGSKAKKLQQTDKVAERGRAPFESHHGQDKEFRELRDYWSEQPRESPDKFREAVQSVTKREIRQFEKEEKAMKRAERQTKRAERRGLKKAIKGIEEEGKRDDRIRRKEEKRDAREAEGGILNKARNKLEDAATYLEDLKREKTTKDPGKKASLEIVRKWKK